MNTKRLDRAPIISGPGYARSITASANTGLGPAGPIYGIVAALEEEVALIFDHLQSAQRITVAGREF